MAIKTGLKPLQTFKRLPRNPKEHDLGAIHQSMDRFGFLEPVVVNERTGNLLSGHGRIDTLQQKKANGSSAPEGVSVEGKDWLIPTSFVDLAETEEEAAAVALNRLVELGGWDNTNLAAILSDYAAQDALDGIGYDADDLDRLIGDLAGKTIEPPSDFREYDEDIGTHHECPKCGYKWSGGK